MFKSVISTEILISGDQNSFRCWSWENYEESVVDTDIESKEMFVLTIPMIPEVLNCLKLKKSQKNGLLITVFVKIETLMKIFLKL